MLECVIIRGGKVAEWLKALVLKTRDGNIRRFESCPFRQENEEVPKGLIHFLDEDRFEPKVRIEREARDSHILSFPPH